MSVSKRLCIEVTQAGVVRIVPRGPHEMTERIAPADHVFTLTHFGLGGSKAANWFLSVGGQVERRSGLTLARLGADVLMVRELNGCSLAGRRACGPFSARFYNDTTEGKDCERRSPNHAVDARVNAGVMAGGRRRAGRLRLALKRAMTPERSRRWQADVSMRDRWWRSSSMPETSN